MSEMDFFHGYFEKSDLSIVPEDTDEFYDFEEENQCYFVSVKGQLYKIWRSEIHTDPYGFSAVLPPCDKPQLMLFWYNGGAGFHEVAECAIQKWVDNSDKLS